MLKKQRFIILYAVSILGLFAYFKGWFNPLLDKLHKDKPPVNIVLLILDSTRADYLGCYGSSRGVTSNIDTLAKNGTCYLTCSAQGTWTLPSVASLYTGVSQRAHGINNRGDCMLALSEEYETLPEILGSYGFDTYALFNITTLDESYGFWQGIDHVNGVGCQIPPMIRADSVVNIALDWLDERENQPGFFMQLHFTDPHYPYDPPAEFWNALGLTRPSAGLPPANSLLAALNNGEITDEIITILRALYEAEIYYMDREIGRLIAELKVRNLYDNTIFIVIADHGEEFMEHGKLLHGYQLYQETIHVPWIMAGPNIPKNITISQPVGLYDVLPTLAYYLGFDCPDYVEGTPAVVGQRVHPYIPSSGDVTGELNIATIRVGDIKLFWGPEMDYAMGCYVDSGEVAENMKIADSVLTALIMNYWATPVLINPPVIPNSEDRAATLRGLGYLR